MDTKDEYTIKINRKSVSVSKEVYDVYYKMGRRERYLEEADHSHGVVSGDSIIDRTAVNDGLSGVEEALLTQELHDTLHRCINALPPQEQALIRAIYYEGKTERDYADEIGLSKSGVNYRRVKALTKLRVMLKNIFEIF